jgi:putative glutamine amidotransferase
MTRTLPLIGLISDLRALDSMPYHVVGDKYAAAVRDFADALPVGLLPTLDASRIEQLAASFDGFLFTGSASNIHPTVYGGTADCLPYDEMRDGFAIPLARLVIQLGKPALFVCRGFQELNIAFGGSLNPDLAAAATDTDHHPPAGLDYADRYAPAHEVILTPGSALENVFGASRFQVNSLHYQGLASIGQGLTVHGTAPDGLAEVVAVDDHPFAIGVQWHPEYRPDLNPASRNLLTAFGAAVRLNSPALSCS